MSETDPLLETGPLQVFPSALPVEYDEEYIKKHSGRVAAEEAIQQTGILISDFNIITSEIAQQPKTSQIEKSEKMKDLDKKLIDNLTNLLANKIKLEKRLNEIKWTNRNPRTWTDQDGSRAEQKNIIEGLLLQIKDAIKSKFKSITKNRGGNIELVTNNGSVLILEFFGGIFKFLTIMFEIPST